MNPRAYFFGVAMAKAGGWFDPPQTPQGPTYDPRTHGPISDPRQLEDWIRQAAGTYGGRDAALRAYNGDLDMWHRANPGQPPPVRQHVAPFNPDDDVGGSMQSTLGFTPLGLFGGFGTVKALGQAGSLAWSATKATGRGVRAAPGAIAGAVRANPIKSVAAAGTAGVAVNTLANRQAAPVTPGSTVSDSPQVPGQGAAPAAPSQSAELPAPGHLAAAPAFKARDAIDWNQFKGRPGGAPRVPGQG